MRVKICGITNLEDALSAVDCGADALGFVFYEKSPRYIKPKIAREIIDNLPPFVERVGLFVECSSDEVNQICQEANISLAQIHFEASESFYKELKVKYIKVIRAKKEQDLDKFLSEYRLVDAFVESFGGEGKRVELDWFRKRDCSKIILAGGLSSDNLSQLREFNFYGVDVSSGVEKQKGLKDHKKIREFIKKTKNAQN